MLSTVIGLVFVSVIAILLLIVKNKILDATFFDHSTVFLFVAITSIVCVFFYYGVIIDWTSKQALDAMRALMKLDFSNKMSEFLACCVNLSINEIKNQITELDKDNLKNSVSGSPGIFIYMTSGIAILSIILHLIKNFQKGRSANKKGRNIYHYSPADSSCHYNFGKLFDDQQLPCY